MAKISLLSAILIERKNVMYKIYMISYDLNKPGQNYSALSKELQKSYNWWHYLDSTWLIYTTETVSQVWNRIKPMLDQNDRIFIVEVKNNKQGWLTKDAWDWINRRIK